MVGNRETSRPKSTKGFDMSIKLKVALILSLLGFVSLTGGVYLFSALSVAKNDADIIEVLGRQRMLSQAMAKATLGAATTKDIFSNIENQVSFLDTYINKMRGIYTTMVIGPVKEANVDISINPESEGHPAVPFPATFLRLVNSEVSQVAEEFTVDVISEDPINPDQGYETDMDRKAGAYLLENPTGTFYEKEMNANGMFLNFYTPDTAIVQGCASCHTEIKGQPFQIGDLLGIRKYRVHLSKNGPLGEKMLTPSLGEYEAAKKIFSETLNAMKAGGEYPTDLGMKNYNATEALPDEKSQEIIKSVELKFNELTGIIEKVMISNDSESRFANVTVMLKTSNQLRKISNDLVVQYNSYANKQQQSIRVAIVASTVIILLTVGAVFFFVSKLVLGKFAKLADGMSILSEGNTAVDIAFIDNTDEVGVMAKAVQVFKDNAIEMNRLEKERLEQEKIEEERQKQERENLEKQLLVAAENTRIKVALDNCAANVMVADIDNTIVYMNKAVQDLMISSEKDIRIDLPGFSAAGILGSSFDVFHKNPAHNRKVVEHLKAPHDTRITVGGKTFDLVASPVIDGDGTVLGTTLEWDEITQELAVQEEIDTVVNAVVAGDFTKSIPLEGKEGFMRNLAEAMNQLNTTVSSVIEDVATALSALAKGDLTHQITTNYEGTYETLKQDSNQTSEQLKGIVGKIISSSDEIGSAAEEISSGSTDLSQRTETQAANLEETAASMEELATTVKQNADNAKHANDLAIEARTVAEDGGEVVKKAIVAMSEIEESSKKVSEIIGVIDEIAFQTNLLALNAAVEAARAGDAGRGFAVVAAEVGTLAQRTAGAAKDVKNLILNSDSQIRGGVELTNNTGDSLQEIVESIKKVADIIGDITVASSEQSNGIEETNTAIAGMDEMTQQNAALVQESSTAARSLQTQSRSMGELVSFFNLDQASPARQDGGNSRHHSQRNETAPVTKSPLHAVR